MSINIRIAWIQNLHPPYRNTPSEAKKYTTNKRITNTPLRAGKISMELMRNFIIKSSGEWHVISYFVFHEATNNLKQY